MALASLDDAFQGAAENAYSVFTFTAGGSPPYRYQFMRSPSPVEAPKEHAQPSEPRKNLKRTRPLHDVDSDAAQPGPRKKRRLRRALVTSPLSRPFSSPAMHHVDRGISKVAVWAKQKAGGRILLRKAAIMNRLRLHAIEERQMQQRGLEAAREAFLLQQAETTALPRRVAHPLPPSPLGISNYDAFDQEDNLFRDEADEDEADLSTESQSGLLYSDFSVLDPAEPLVDDHDRIEEKVAPESPPARPLSLCLQQSELSSPRQKNIVFVPFVC